MPPPPRPSLESFVRASQRPTQLRVLPPWPAHCQTIQTAWQRACAWREAFKARSVTLTLLTPTYCDVNTPCACREWARDRVKQDPTYFERLCEQQSPEYLWIGCADSRVPVRAPRFQSASSHNIALLEKPTMLSINVNAPHPCALVCHHLCMESQTHISRCCVPSPFTLVAGQRDCGAGAGGDLCAAQRRQSGGW